MWKFPISLCLSSRRPGPLSGGSSDLQRGFSQKSAVLSLSPLPGSLFSPLAPKLCLPRLELGRIALLAPSFSFPEPLPRWLPRAEGGLECRMV